MVLIITWSFESFKIIWKTIQILRLFAVLSIWQTSVVAGRGYDIYVEVSPHSPVKDSVLRQRGAEWRRGEGGL